MAGRITVASGLEPVILTALDATNATVAYADVDLTVPVPLPVVVSVGRALTLYVADTASITPTVKDTTGAHTIQATATPCRAGLPVNLGPYQFIHASIIA